MLKNINNRIMTNILMEIWALLCEMSPYLLLGFGVLAFSVFVIGELLLVFRAYRSEKWMLLIILILYLLFGMLETSLIRPHCNFFLLLLSEVLWEGSSIKDLNKKEKNLEYIADRT